MKRRLPKGSVRALVVASTSVAYLSLAVPVRAHDDAPLPYPEPLEASPRLAPEVTQGPLTMLYVGIGVVGVASILSLLFMWQRHRARQSPAAQTGDN
jgi:hypothetical protein